MRNPALIKRTTLFPPATRYYKLNINHRVWIDKLCSFRHCNGVLIVRARGGEPTVREANARYTFKQGRFQLPVCSTLLTESSAEKTRHPAILLSLSETGAKFSSRKRVVPGEAVGIILHPDLRYAIRGRVSWTRQMQDDANISFGVAFEEEVPESLWNVLKEKASVA